MSISELISEVGDGNVRCQFLSTAITNARMTKHGTEISFVTSAVSPIEIVAQEGNIGIVIWIPKDKFEAIRERL